MAYRFKQFRLAVSKDLTRALPETKAAVPNPMIGQHSCWLSGRLDDPQNFRALD